MRSTLPASGAIIATVLVAAVLAVQPAQIPPARPTIPPPSDDKALREYAGVYQWGPNAFVYLQLWNEFVGFDKPGQLVAFDESGDVRMLYPSDRDRFFTGKSVAVAEPKESDVEFQRDNAGKIRSLTWRSGGGVPRVATRAEIEKREDVAFSNGNIRLAGTLVSPSTGGRHPAIILVHGSGAENREYMLPWARFLIRHGIAVLGYDKRGVGDSTGDWNVASFDDLAGDVVAAFEYLRARRDIDPSQIGLLGISQAGWIMPLAAIRAKDLAFLISISGAGVPGAETTIDQARNEMTADAMPPPVVDQIVGLMKLQHNFARTGDGWAEYSDALAKLTAMARAAGAQWPPPDLFPDTAGHPYFQFIRRLYFYDPVPTLRQLHVPTLAIWGELDNNIMADKNKAAWEAALIAGGNRDYTLRILPNANHSQFEAKVGSNSEMKSLQRFVPEFMPTVSGWLAKRIRGVQAQALGAAPTARLPSFEVASVKPNKTAEGRGGFSPRADRFVRTGVTVRDLIQSAYRRRGFENVQVVDGPGWLDTDRFDVTAKIEDGAGTLEELYLPDGKGSPGRAYSMVRALLEDRFKLAVHRETREMPIYALTLARRDGRLGPKLARSDIDCDKAMAEVADSLRQTGQPPQRTPGQPPPCSVGGPPGTLDGNDVTMQTLADVLTSSVNRAVSTPVTRAVVDRTGLPGVFRFRLEWRPDEALPDAPGVSIFTALQEQLGLKLAPTRGPVEVLVIDHLEPPTPD